MTITGADALLDRALRETAAAAGIAEAELAWRPSWPARWLVNVGAVVLGVVAGVCLGGMFVVLACGCVVGMAARDKVQRIGGTR